MNLEKPFRGSRAVAAGVVTWDRLAGPTFRRLAPDVHVATSTPCSLRVLLLGLLLWRPEAVVGGLAAAAVWCGVDAAVTPGDGPGTVPWRGVGPIGPVDVVVATRTGAPPGTRVRRDVLAPDEVAEHRGLRLTSPARTVLDLTRRLPRDVAVVAGDAVARRCRVPVAAVDDLAEHHGGERGVVAARRALRLLEPGSGTPLVSWFRLALAEQGVQQPVADHLVSDDRGMPLALADLAWPARRSAVLCGERDVGPCAALRLRELGARGWWVLTVPDDRADDPRLSVCSLRGTAAMVGVRLRREAIAAAHRGSLLR